VYPTCRYQVRHTDDIVSDAACGVPQSQTENSETLSLILIKAMVASFDVYADSSITVILASYSVSRNILLCRCYTQFMNLIYVFPCIIIYGFIRTSLMQIV